MIPIYFVPYLICFSYFSIIYESGEGLEEDEIQRYETLSKKVLADVGIENGSTVEISDFSQKLDVTIVVVDSPAADSEKTSEDDAFEIVSGEISQHLNTGANDEKESVIPENEPKKEEDKQNDESDPESDDDDLVIL